VHGFKDSRASILREYLERGLKNATREQCRDTARASAFAFDEIGILLEGFDEVEIASDKLLAKVESLKVSVFHPLECTLLIRTFKAVDKGLRNKRAKDPNPPKKFIFVAQGLGAWVVQNGLARLANLKLSYATIGVIFMDVPDVNSRDFNYSQFLRARFEDSGEQSPFPKEEDFSKHLLKLGCALGGVHKNWKNIVGESEHVKGYAVWPIKSPIDISRVKLMPPEFFWLLIRACVESEYFAGAIRTNNGKESSSNKASE
jgi:hypothetical protein